MENIRLSNAWVEAEIAPKGAELQSFFSKGKEIQFMWSGDPAFWGKFSPVLFPIVGTLKNNSYFFEGKKYILGRHGFARDRVFEVEKQSEATCTFVLTSDPVSMDVFPFDFELKLVYTLEERSLSLRYEVVNTGKKQMYFSLGGHPAFSVPFLPGTSYEDYRLEFNRVFSADRFPITPDGLISEECIPVIENSSFLPLRKELFKEDALVFRRFAAEAVTIVHKDDPLGLCMEWKNFPFMGIWAAPGADFICIEPWCGIADGVNASGDLTEKEGIQSLEAGGVFSRSWGISIVNP